MMEEKQNPEKYKQTISFKIGEVAKRANVNKETVRYYEKRKLIPKPDRRRSGYRIFTQRHIDQIRFIKRAQELGFTLSEIKELLE
ncbi:MAG: MerR family transcriptional regulator, partial [Gracilimonas sp.]